MMKATDNGPVKASTYFALMAEFGSGNVELDKVCEKYFGLTIDEAKRRAATNRLPIPAFRSGSQKSPWLVSLSDLAAHLDAQHEAARMEWSKSQTGTARRESALA